MPLSDDGSIPEDSAFLRWILDIKSASESADRMFFLGDQHATWLREVGFVNVQEAVFKIPINGWPRERALKHVGMLWQRNLLTGMSGFSLGLLHRVRGRTVEEIEVGVGRRKPETPFPSVIWRTAHADETFLPHNLGISCGCSARPFRPKHARLPETVRRVGSKASVARSMSRSISAYCWSLMGVRW